MRKGILCFGDSNTYGYDPAGGRYDEETRWPMVMQRILGEGYRVVEEGLGGRTFSQDDPTEGGFKSGISYLPPCLKSHNPLELVIVMLGTNDTKQRFGLNAQTIAHNLNEVARIVRSYGMSAGTAPGSWFRRPASGGDQPCSRAPSGPMPMPSPWSWRDSCNATQSCSSATLWTPPPTCSPVLPTGYT